MSSEAIIVNEGDAYCISYIAHDGTTTLDVRATARKRDDTAVYTDFALTHVSGGYYSDDSKTMTSDAELIITIVPYTTYSSARSDIHAPAELRVLRARNLKVDLISFLKMLILKWKS